MCARRSHRCIQGSAGRGLLGAGLVVAGLALALPAAASSEEATSEQRTPPVRKVRLDSERLVPRVSLQMESFSTFQQAWVHGGALDDHVLFDEMSEAVRRGAESVTRKRLREHLLHSIHLDRRVDRLREEIRGGLGMGTAVGFDFGVHSGLPQVGIRYRRGQAQLRFRIGADGEAGVVLKNRRYDQGTLSAIYDHEDETFTVRARLGF